MPTESITTTTPQPESRAAVVHRSNGDGSNASNSRIIWFILTTITTVMLGMAAAWANSTSDTLNECERRIAELERKFERIDTKLDTIIEYNRTVRTDRQIDASHTTTPTIVPKR